MLNIATHNKIFHADEVTAIALLKLFTDEEIVVHRIDHQSEDFSAYDMVIDISKKFDGEKYFDHHQNKGGKSSAGLIWDYLGLGLEYPRISKLIHHVDLNDTGIKKSR
ncbi:MAG: MYG1 family protein [Sulfurospirillum sp.]|nr:MYG1 family protein [Sulfurospirillum sp.]